MFNLLAKINFLIRAFSLWCKKSNDSILKQEEDLKQDDLPRLMSELEQLQASFDLAAVKKYKLNIELESCIQRLDAASLIIEK
jgi:hypothetical protein